MYNGSVTPLMAFNNAGRKFLGQFSGRTHALVFALARHGVTSYVVLFINAEQSQMEMLIH
jgi:hypothetical protein